MKPDMQFWHLWEELLHRWGVKHWAALALEFAGPLSVLGAQLLYIGAPLLGEFVPRNHLDALTCMLEEPAQTKAFVSYLREAS